MAKYVLKHKIASRLQRIGNLHSKTQKKIDGIDGKGKLKGVFVVSAKAL